MTIMAMNLRLDDEQDRVLTALAEAEGVSKNEAAIRAIMDRAARLTREARVREATDEVIERYGPLLDRLAQ